MNFEESYLADYEGLGYLFQLEKYMKYFLFICQKNLTSNM